MKKFEHIVYSIGVLAWGLILIWFYQSDLLTQYLDDKFHIYVLIGGLVAMVLAVFNLCTQDSKAAGCCDHGDHEEEHEHEHGDDCGHEHGSDMHPMMALILLLLPLGAALAVTQHGFTVKHEMALSDKDVDASSFSFVDLPPFTIETLEDTRSKSADGAFQLNLLELFFSAGDVEQEKVMNGLYVETEGKLRDEQNRNPDGKRMRLYRLFMTCCAADTKAIPLSIEFDGELPDISHNSWVRVAGIISYERKDGVVYPVLKVKSIKSIPVPEGEWSEGVGK